MIMKSVVLPDGLFSYLYNIYATKLGNLVQNHVQKYLRVYQHKVLLILLKKDAQKAEFKADFQLN